MPLFFALGRLLSSLPISFSLFIFSRKLLSARLNLADFRLGALLPSGQFSIQFP